MKKTTFWVAALACAALLVSGGLFASNMGFKLNYPLTGPAAFPEDGTNTLALPYNAQTGITGADDLISDIGGAACSASGPVVSVARYVKATAGLESYNGCTGAPFTLASGEGYLVKVDSDTNYIVVGSHKPGFAVNLTGPAAFPEDGTNVYSYPYHSTATDANALISDIGGAACSASGPVVSIARYVKSTAGLEAYNGCTGSPFGLEAGAAYFVKVDTDTAYVPSHF